MSDDEVTDADIRKLNPESKLPTCCWAALVEMYNAAELSKKRKAKKLLVRIKDQPSAAKAYKELTNPDGWEYEPLDNLLLGIGSGTAHLLKVLAEKEHKRHFVRDSKKASREEVYLERLWDTIAFYMQTLHRMEVTHESSGDQYAKCFRKDWKIPECQKFLHYTMRKASKKKRKASK